MALQTKLSLIAATVAVAALAVAVAPQTSAAPAAGHAPVHKINVLGEWAHPDDDTSIVGPCGVWHQLYGIKCGIIQVTRGEGGGNAIGPETGPALGLRRENEDRAAHFRSGTADLFYVDRVDFYYNQSAPLTQFFWDHDQTLARITRIIRETQPDIYIGFTPTLAAGHGNHQEAGRFIWEGVQAAADPHMFPDQLTGPNALSTWQGQEGLLRRVDDRHRRDDNGGRLHHGIRPGRHEPQHCRRRMDGLPLAVHLAGREPAGPAGRDAQDLGAGRV